MVAKAEIAEQVIASPDVQKLEEYVDEQLRGWRGGTLSIKPNVTLPWGELNVLANKYRDAGWDVSIVTHFTYTNKFDYNSYTFH